MAARRDLGRQFGQQDLYRDDIALGQDQTRRPTVARIVGCRLDRTAIADTDAAQKQWWSVADRLRPRVPKLAALFDTAEAAVTRLVGVILLEQNDEWAIQRRFGTIETLAPISDAPPVLPACGGSLTAARPRSVTSGASTPRHGT